MLNLFDVGTFLLSTLMDALSLATDLIVKGAPPSVVSAQTVPADQLSVAAGKSGEMRIRSTDGIERTAAHGNSVSISRSHDFFQWNRCRGLKMEGGKWMTNEDEFPCPETPRERQPLLGPRRAMAH